MATEDLFFDEALPPWRVIFKGDFLSLHGRGKPGQEKLVMKAFDMAGERWLIAAVYFCGSGLVVDFCKLIEPENLRNFMTKWHLTPDNNDTELNLSEKDSMKMIAENPYTSEIRAEVKVNGRILESSHGFGESWNPFLNTNFLLPAKAVLAHYKLDADKGWLFWRQAYHWAGSGKPRVKDIEFSLSLEPVEIAGPHLYKLETGVEMPFIHPITGKKHCLNIVESLEEELTEQDFNIDDWEFPRFYSQITYTITPDLPDNTYSLRDISQGDAPRISSNILNDCEPEVSGAASLAIIGSADGPTTIFWTKNNIDTDTDNDPIPKTDTDYVTDTIKNNSSERSNELLHHKACSSLYFYPPKVSQWQLIFWYSYQEESVNIKWKV